MYWCEILDSKTSLNCNVKLNKIIDSGLKISNINFIADKVDSMQFLFLITRK